MSGQNPVIKTETDLDNLYRLNTPTPEPIPAKEVNVELSQTVLPESELSRGISTERKKKATLRPLIAVGTDLEVKMSQKIVTTTTKETSVKTQIKNGILKNPYFPYSGNPISKFLSLLANILKFFEQLLVGKLENKTHQPNPTFKNIPAEVKELGRSKDREGLKSRL